MESDLEVQVKGLSDELAYMLSEGIMKVVSTLEQIGEGLDLRRMHRIIVAEDFAGELTELSASTISGEPITHTDEDYAIGVAKVTILPLSEDYEIVPVISANYATALLTPAMDVDEDTNADSDDELGEGTVSTSSDLFEFVLNGLHHELCHVHDYNKHIDAFGPLIVSYREGKDIYIRPLAEACWAEYFADLISSTTVPLAWLGGMAESFSDAIVRTKPHLDKEILAFRHHGDVGRLVDEFQRHAGFLVKSAAYILGYVDGLNMSLDEISAETSEHLVGSYFEPTWNAMHKALQEMYQPYPDAWRDPSVYDGLAAVIDRYYVDMGMILSTTSEGIHANFPFTPETTP